MSEDDIAREQDLAFLAKLKTADMLELMHMERQPENWKAWRQCALSRALWRTMLK